jgi:hypothetical protein
VRPLSHPLEAPSPTLTQPPHSLLEEPGASPLEAPSPTLTQPPLFFHHAGVEPTRTLIGLSRGGADAVVRREFDLVDKAFVKGGFELPEAKSRCAWQSRDVLIVGTDMGEGSLTDSGYPRTVREWKRGTPLEESVEVRCTAVGFGHVSRLPRCAPVGVAHVKTL